MADFDPAAFNKLSVLPPERLRHHLVSFDEALEALSGGQQCDKFIASNLVDQAHMFGFPCLATSLEDLFGFCGSASSERALRVAKISIKRAKLKIASLLEHPAVTPGTADPGGPTALGRE